MTFWRRFHSHMAVLCGGLLVGVGGQVHNAWMQVVGGILMLAALSNLTRVKLPTPEPEMDPDAKVRPWMYTGEPLYIEGVPFGKTMNPGDFYTARTPIGPDDVDMLKKVVDLQALNEECMALTRQAHAQLDVVLDLCRNMQSWLRRDRVD